GVKAAVPEKLKTRDARRARLENRLAELEKPFLVYAGTFQTPQLTYVLKRGDPLQPLEKVPPSAVRGVGQALVLSEGASDSQRRVAPGPCVVRPAHPLPRRGIADPANPLPARVMVNRLWHYHFGQGLVRTPSDFGYNGGRPSHPDLLDWLASEFQASGGRLKPLHRLIVLSSTYRQSSWANADARRVDAGC